MNTDYLDCLLSFHYATLRITMKCHIFWTALHWAARRGHTNICLILLENGFSEEVKDKNNQTPFEVSVCSEDNETLRALLRPESWNEENMPEAVGKRRCSADSNQNDRFVPNYIKHPPFPYSKASSFDGGTTLPSSPVSPLSNGTGYYSYGRRGSVNRTRFLLVRTCAHIKLLSCADGKQAFKRVTLPGGSSVAQLKKMIEKSMRNGEVKSIVTLPDRVLIEEDSQIAQFADCQKVEVVYASTEDTKNGVS
ncbi:unnamed protein product [Nippostrongylus brasiliensis]|uniref:ANK_REP_REGION domain-containing protein n=1 Tax=Nippostrongylus brasiliensis TaxID=27835 RepID=A0A158QZM4_NIPBR|nr:unnamed protein product [Nippostrongylus brasiliensis]